MDAGYWLVTYGTPAPGAPHHQPEPAEGRWSRGPVHGTFADLDAFEGLGCRRVTVGGRSAFRRLAR